MKASLVIIGDEILLGQVTDTNSGEIARTLIPMGWEISSTHIVGDDADQIHRAVTDAMAQSQLVITTGGLGATKDDITKRVMCKLWDCNLHHDPAVEQNIERVFAARGLTVNDLTRTQAMVPDNCRIIQNIYGTAPIMWFERDDKVVISMPGVPFETVGMLHLCIADAIRQRFLPDISYRHHTLILSGLTETQLAMHLDAYEDALPASLHLAYLPVPGYIRLRLDGAAADKSALDALYDRALDQLRRLVAPWLMHDGDATPAEILLEKLKAKGLTLSTAESCTGGNIAHCITSIPGSSECFLGAVVSYANSVKTGILHVEQLDIEAEGAVSETVVRQMATGVAAALHTDCAVATSGIAGPAGGTPQKPVGTVWMAAHACGHTIAVCRKLPGSRQRVIERASTEALLLLIKLLSEI